MATAFNQLWKFLPSIFVLSGGLLAASGAFWAAYRQSVSSVEIRNKNEEIISLQKQNIDLLRGGSVLSLMVLLQPDEVGSFPIAVMNANDLPVYDVRLNILSGLYNPAGTPEETKAYYDQMNNQPTLNIGTVSSGMSEIGLRLKPGHYQFTIRTRYANFTEILRFGPFQGEIAQSALVQGWDGKVVLKTTSPDGYKPVY